MNKCNYCSYDRDDYILAIDKHGHLQIVIEISDRLIKKVKDHYVNPYEVDEICEAILDGTPLPKGHGDLVDFNRLCEEYWDGNYMEIHKDDLPNIKPIIEADRR